MRALGWVGGGGQRGGCHRTPDLFLTSNKEHLHAVSQYSACSHHAQHGSKKQQQHGQQLVPLCTEGVRGGGKARRGEGDQALTMDHSTTVIAGR